MDEFKHLETLPLDEFNLIKGVNPESNIKSKSCLNLSFLTSDTINRLASITSVNHKTLKEVLSSNNYNSYLAASYILENFICLLLITSSISNVKHTQLTEHYKKYTIRVSNQRILPSFKHCQELMYSNFKTWIGPYGSLSYFNALNETYQEYLSPSSLIYSSLTGLFKHSKRVIQNQSISFNREYSFNNYNLVLKGYEEIEELMYDEEEGQDVNIFRFNDIVFRSIPEINVAIEQLSFYEKWIPQLYRYITSNIESIEESSNSNRVLYQLGLTMIQKGLDDKITSSLLASLFRQSIKNNVLEFVEICNRYLLEASQSFSRQEYANDKEEELLSTLVNNIELSQTSINYQSLSSFLLNVVAPPGGYNLLQISIAAVLVERAYSLSYRNRNNKDYNDEGIWNRIYKLVSLSSILLIRTQLYSASSIGLNMLKTFNISLENIEINNIFNL